MAFSIDWFLTVPGILISIGVILLIVALIMFIVSAMKEKKGETAPSVLENNQVNNTPVMEVQEVVEQPVNVEQQPVNVEQSFGFEQPHNVETPLIDTVSEEVVVPSFEGDNIIPTIDEQMVNVVPEVSNNSNFIPADDDLLDIVVPTEKVNNDVITTNEINASNNFEIPEPIVEVEQRPIYGGADPLEATQTLPRMDVHHEPYSGGSKEVNVNVVPEVPNVVEPFVGSNEQVLQPEVPFIVEPVSVPTEEPSIISIPDGEEIEEL